MGAAVAWERQHRAAAPAVKALSAAAGAALARALIAAGAAAALAAPVFSGRQAARLLLLLTGRLAQAAAAGQPLGMAQRQVLAAWAHRECLLTRLALAEEPGRQGQPGGLALLAAWLAVAAGLFPLCQSAPGQQARVERWMAPAAWIARRVHGREALAWVVWARAARCAEAREPGAREALPRRVAAPLALSCWRRQPDRMGEWRALALCRRPEARTCVCWHAGAARRSSRKRQ